MSIFGIIKSDDVVFSGDKIRIDASESFLAPNLTFATVSHEVSVDGGATWYNITGPKKYVDWIFSTSGTKTISLRLSTTEPASEIFTKDITVLNLATANLFSNDSDLYQYETDINQYLPKKWSSWNLIHLAAQKHIVDWLDEKRIFAQDGTKYTQADLLDKSEVRQFSIFKTLELIFASNYTIVGDIFSSKRDKYRELANEKASRAQISLDFNKDTINNDATERTDLLSVIVRRA